MPTFLFQPSFFGGKPAEVLSLLRRGKLLLLCSMPTREEVEGVLAEKFEWPRGRIRSICDPYWKAVVLVEPRETIRACSDPDDNRVLECAMAGA